ncbi:MAG: hypothetical protein C4532_01840 [Candidatus Abyssobacteria bacterium SURF_17]|uniref:Co-chaperone DjlA N-terminal domain-containing protein n=1 Tax=Candidatus Abyssobacteria bacterium SURF_17 TaxID=2093361 RepID=A0A419F826_9BACT|nr:MAG: hypothetical protein C4532_01840 [Candidatus Abyssubacteria bacterium SURF_17]
MLKKLSKLFFDVKPNVAAEDKEEATVRPQIATCVLLLEIAHSDDHFSDEEQSRIVELLKEDFQLSDEYAAELLELAHQERKESSDLWRFTSVIDKNYSIEEKERVVETLWKLVYADDRLHFREDHLIHRLSRLLNLSHKQLIEAKKKVMGWT